MFGVMAYWTANIDVWFKDCKLNTRVFVGLVSYIVMLVYEHLLGSGISIQRPIYNPYLGFMNYVSAYFSPRNTYKSIFPHACTA